MPVGITRRLLQSGQYRRCPGVTRSSGLGRAVGGVPVDLLLLSHARARPSATFGYDAVETWRPHARSGGRQWQGDEAKRSQPAMWQEERVTSAEAMPVSTGYRAIASRAIRRLYR